MDALPLCVGRAALAASLLVLACSDPTGAPADLSGVRIAEGAPFAVRGVTVLTMESAEPLPGQTVVVRDGRIERVGPSDRVRLSPGVQEVDGSGLYLMPGLVDSHVHVVAAELPRYLEHGVTSVRNLWGYRELEAIRREVDAGTRLGPAIHTVSPGLDGTPPTWPQTQLVLDPADADSIVAAQARAGYRALKVYQNLTREAYDSIVASAGRRGLAFLGHVPTRVGLRRVLEAGQLTMEHLGGYSAEMHPQGARHWLGIDASRMASLAAATRDAGAWNCPTLAIQTRGGAPLEGVVNRRRMVRALHEAGARLVVGTDSGIGQTEPGASMAQELAELVAAGLPAHEVLRAATLGGAELLGLEGEIGSVREGKRADLVLLRGDPLRDPAAAASPAAVILRGRWLPLPLTP